MCNEGGGEGGSKGGMAERFVDIIADRSAEKNTSVLIYSSLWFYKLP